MIDVFELEKNFLYPLLDVLSKQRLDERTKTLNKHASNCTKNVNAIRFEKKYIIINITTIIEQYKSLLAELSSIIDFPYKKWQIRNIFNRSNS